MIQKNIFILSFVCAWLLTPDTLYSSSHSPKADDGGPAQSSPSPIPLQCYQCGARANIYSSNQQGKQIYICSNCVHRLQVKALVGQKQATGAPQTSPKGDK